jgi:subtilase family serine protease
LGDELIIELEIYDVDSDMIAVTSSKSWAMYDGEGTVIVSPVEVGNHELIITATDGEVEISEKIDIFVYSNADLLIESLDIRKSGVTASELVIGDVIELVIFVRNQGLERATNISTQCSMSGIIIQTKTIQSLEPGELKAIICDVQLVSYGNIEFEFNVDAINSIIELNEDNNNYSDKVSKKVLPRWLVWPSKRLCV